jgi:hypothetical protein
MFNNIINSMLDHVISSRKAKADASYFWSFIPVKTGRVMIIRCFAGRTWWSACTDLWSREQNLSGEISSTVHKCFLECHNLDFLSCNVGYQLRRCSRYLCQSIAWFHGEKQKFWCKISSSIFSSAVMLFEVITILINLLPRTTQVCYEYVAEQGNELYELVVIVEAAA